MPTILFVMPEPGYLRLYATTLLGLAGRGHDVRVAYDKPSRKDRNADALDGAPPTLTTIGAVPPHGGPWRQALSDLGCTVDYIRFLSRDGTPYLRSRMDRYLPAKAAGLRRLESLPAWAVRGLAGAAALVERAVPVDPSLTRYLAAQQLDALVVTPLVLRGPSGVQQHQLVKAARVAGIPVALAVGSWDHLSSKGLLRVEPDLVIVWNDVQRREAMEQHGVPAERLVVTGAQPFDLWFGHQPTLGRAEFCARVGLPADRPMVLYAGSSRGIADPAIEIPFVRRWLEAVRDAGDATVREAAVLVRPHLSNVEAWTGVDLSGLGDVSIWPRVRPSLPMNELETSDYFHSIHYSAAVVGINTSAMIEASILDKPVLTVEGADFAATQGGTKHFHYLVPRGGGCVLSAPSFEAHVEQLANAVADPGRGRADRARFVASFVRPNGLARPAVESVVQAIERLTTLRPRRQPDRPAWLAPLRWVFRLATARTPPEPAG